MGIEWHAGNPNSAAVDEVRSHGDAREGCAGDPNPRPWKCVGYRDQPSHMRYNAFGGSQPLEKSAHLGGRTSSGRGMCTCAPAMLSSYKTSRIGRQHGTGNLARVYFHCAALLALGRTVCVSSS
eukprot:1159461-Pelagomonas_calceolata.AAC.8